MSFFQRFPWGHGHRSFRPWRRWWWHDLRWNLRAWFQWCFRGYAEAEVWSVGDALPRYLLPRLRELRRHDIGCPGALCYRPDGSEVPIEEACAAWTAIQDAIIEAVEMYVEDRNVLLKSWMQREGREEEYRKARRGFLLLAKWWEALWW